MLAEVREGDFVLYCALLDAAFFRLDGRLLLEMGHRYCYETLALERCRTNLATLLPSYDGGVFLRFRGEVTECAARGAGEDVQEAPASEVTAPPFSQDPHGEGQPSLPFEGLAQEVARLMEGELVLVRQDASALDAADGSESVNGEEEDEE